MNPQVSVVIPTYNRASKVARSIESVLGQTFKDLEILVVDDGSTDGTGKSLDHAFDRKIRYFYQSNQGVSVARNKGIEEARGEWIAFLDSDDQWESEKLERQFDALKQCGPRCSACYTDVRFFNHPETRTMFELAQDSYRHEGPVGVSTDALRLLVRPGGAGMVICLSSLLARKELMRDLGGFDRDISYSQDSEFMFRMAMRTGFCYVTRPLVLFDRSPHEERHVGVSAAWNETDFFLQDSQLRLQRLQTLTAGQPRPIRDLIRRQLGSVHSGWVNWYLQAGDYGKARKAAYKAASLNLTPSIAAKCLLTWVNPSLALRAVRQREKKNEASFTV